MAILSNRHLNQRIMLRPLHAFGRDPTASRTVIPCPEVSKIHALARWNVCRWEIQDQSRNGSMMNGMRLPHGQWLPLANSAELVLGACLAAQWQVMDLEPPTNCLLPQDGGAVIALHPDGTLVPDRTSPQLHIHCHASDWIAEGADGDVVLIDGELLLCDQRSWEVVLCPDQTRTIHAPHAGVPGIGIEVALRFDLSQDEEHAQLTIALETGEIDLGERTHHYLLATLARLRLQDAQRNLPTHSQGWIATTKLARMLGVDASHLNIQIFRARQQFAHAAPPELSSIALIERRRGELRLGNHGFTVLRGSVVEGTLVRRPSGDLVCL